MRKMKDLPTDQEGLRKLWTNNIYDFKGKFVRYNIVDLRKAHVSFGDTPVFYMPQLVLTDVRLVQNNKLISNNLAIPCNSGVRKFGRLRPRDEIQFRGKITYKHRYPNSFVKHEFVQFYLTSLRCFRHLNPNKAHGHVPYDEHTYIGFVMYRMKKHDEKHLTVYDPDYVEKYKEWRKSLK